MKVNVSIPQDIYLSLDQMVDVTLETLKQLFDIPEDAFINDEGFLIQWVNTHGSGFDDKIREATDDDRKYFEIIKMIQDKGKKE